jgi:hypothetical protein
MKKTLFLNGLKVNYEVSKDGIVLISFYSPYEMTDGDKKKMLVKLGNYLIAEGFVKLPIDEQQSV